MNRTFEKPEDMADWHRRAHDLVLTHGTAWNNEGISGRLNIRCISGIIWLTEEGCREDILLHEGEYWMTSADRLVLIESLSERAHLLLEEWLAPEDMAHDGNTGKRRYE